MSDIPKHDHSSSDRLVYMANQIGKFFAHKREDEAVVEIAEHIKSFWEKRMLAEIFAYIDAGGAGLDERPKLALISLRNAGERPISSAA